MVLARKTSEEPIGPGWVARDLSEIKPGGFSAMRSLENQFDSLRKDDVKLNATTDPMHKYYKRLLPKPRETEVFSRTQRPEREENYRNPTPKGLRYDTSDRGLSLMENYLKELPRDRIVNLSSDVASLKKELRQAAIRETDEVKSKVKPNSAHKVYAWRDLLEEREPKSRVYSCTKVPSEVYLPDKTSQLVTLYHKEHSNEGKIKRMNGYWQIPKIGPTPTRDRYGLRILNNLELECDTIDAQKKSTLSKDYHYTWPFTDSNTGDSVQTWVKP